MISTDYSPSSFARHAGEHVTFNYHGCWRDITHNSKQGAPGSKSQKQVCPSVYHPNRALGKPTSTRLVVYGGVHCRQRRRGRRGVEARGPKFKATRTAEGDNFSRACDSNINNKVVDCHRRSSKVATTITTITTKKTTVTSRRQWHNICTQRFKHDRWLVSPAGAGAAATATDVVAATTTTTTVDKGGKRAGAPITDCNNILTQFSAHDRGSRHSDKTQHNVRCDNNNLYHHPQQHSSLSLSSSLSSTYHHHHHTQNHRSLAHYSDTTNTANIKAAIQPRWVPATSRHFRATHSCSSLGRRSGGGATSICVLPASSRSTPLPVTSAGPSLKLLAETVQATPITTTPAAITSCTAGNSSSINSSSSSSSSSSRNHRLLSCFSYPLVPSRPSQVGPVVVALPFAWASSSVSLSERSVARESRSSRSSSVGEIISSRQGGQCRSAKVELVPTTNRRITTNKNVQDEVQKSTSESVTIISGRKSKLSMKPEDHRYHKSTMTSGKPIMTSITNDHRMAATAATGGTQSSQATGHHQHHNRANVRAPNNSNINKQPLVARNNNKPLFETPSIAPLIGTMHQPLNRAQQSQQRNSSTTNKPWSNESQIARNQRGGGASSLPQSELPAISKIARAKVNNLVSNKHPNVSSHHVAPSPTRTIMAQDINNNELLDELQANVHSLEFVGQRARMAISIYDPLPAQVRQEHGEECHVEQNQVGISSPSTGVKRPTILKLNHELNATTGNMSMGLQTRRRPPRRRETLYGDRFLRSPTIPEEPSELAALGDDELATLSQVPLGSARSRATKRHHQANGGPEGFLVATIEPEWGGVSKTVIVHSNATIDSLTQDVLKRLIEIEHDQQSSIRARMRAALDDRPKDRTSIGRKNRPAIGDMNKLQELESEAEKLAKMFKQQLDVQQQERNRELSMTSFHDDDHSAVQQKCDPTAMTGDEQTRFSNPIHKPDDRHKPKCIDKDNVKGDHNQNSDSKSAFDFRSSCCCLHLVDQPKRADGETWCCCGCS